MASTALSFSWLIGLALGLRMALAGCLAADAAEPANPQATPQARAVLKYLHELSGRREGRRILSGQFSDFGHRANLGLMERIHEKTGHWPGLIGVDYADFGRGSLTCKTPNQVAIDYWKQGGLVTVMAHLYNPANPKGGGLRDRGVHIADLLQPATDTHRRWMQELDLAAEGLRELRDAGVVVLWRPFHEMNGGWFWWGAQEPDKFIAVWRHMFDYFSKTKGLDNLLWVYGPNHGRNTAGYYAGDRYVDLVGLDAYTDFVDRQHIKGYEEVAALPKPFGFTEYGPHGSQNPPGNYDYRRFIAGLEKEFPRACFFMCWNANWSLATNGYTRELLAHPSLVNREDVPATLFKTDKSEAGVNAMEEREKSRSLVHPRRAAPRRAHSEHSELALLRRICILLPGTHRTQGGRISITVPMPYSTPCRRAIPGCL